MISSVFACFLPNSTAYRDIDHSHAVLYGSSLAGSQVPSLPKPYKPRCHLCHNSGLPAGLPHPVRRPEFPRVFPYTFSAPTDEPLMNAAPLPLKEHLPCAYTGPRAPSARSISPTLPERSPTIPRAVLEERPCQPRRRAEPGISHRSRGWGCRWQSKQSPVIECDSGKSVIPPAWHRRFPRIPVPLHAGSSNPIQGHRGNRRD